MRLIKRLAAPTVHLLAKFFSPCVLFVREYGGTLSASKIPGFEIEVGDADV